MKENTEKIFHLTMLDADNKDKLSELEEAIDFICSDSPISDADICHCISTERNVLREDTAVTGELQESILSCAPNTADGYIMVPKTVK